LLNWPGLSRSPQLAKFLNYIVRAKLGGDEASIKAYSIAVDVFGRPPTFDPQSDPIVRVQARRLRAALAEYYAGEGSDSPVRIYLPVGRYIPEFRGRDDAAAPEVPIPEPPREPVPQLQLQRSRRRISGGADWLLYGILLLIGTGIVFALTQVLMPRPTRIEVPGYPTIGIAEFTVISPGAREAPALNISGLAIELVTDLQLFDDVQPTYTQGGPPEDDDPDYQLTGIARQEAGLVQVTASLRRRGSDTALWSLTQTVRADQLQGSIDDISQAFAAQLGSHRGPLFFDAYKWLEDNPSIAGNETVFLCGLLFSRYRDSAEVVDAARARDCIASVLARGEDALALAMRGGLLLDDVAATQLRIDPEPLAEAERLLTQALRLDATSSTIWREYASYLSWAGRWGEADAAYASALQLNPANLDAVAGFARMLSVRAASLQGIELAARALRGTVDPPHWYNMAPAINALRAGKDEEAIAFAEKLAEGDAEMGATIATVAALRSADVDVLNRYFAQLLDVTRFRRFGILPVLQQRIFDSALLDEIAAQLKRAGVADAALDGNF
jgi:tetratricopeptide (TPR) repeat protein